MFPAANAASPGAPITPSIGGEEAAEELLVGNGASSSRTQEGNIATKASTSCAQSLVASTLLRSPEAAPLQGRLGTKARTLLPSSADDDDNEGNDEEDEEEEDEAIDIA